MKMKNYSGLIKLLALLILFIIALIITIISTWILDILIALNLTFAFLILIAAYRTKKAADFPLLPTLLVLSIVLSLAVNISSTRLILAKGAIFDGCLINFISHLVNGLGFIRLITCFTIFIVINLLQIVIIIKRVSRVTQVTSQFNHDAISKRNMAIDAEYSAGTITITETKAKKNDICNEKDFYEALNGTCKFLFGYEKIRLLIIILSIFGGILIGTIIQENTIIEAVRIYIPLAIGNGLFPMLPPILLSFAIVKVSRFDTQA